jgi:ribonuclease R
VLGVLRGLDDGTFRIEPVERRQPELVVDPEFIGRRKPGDLVEVEPSAHRPREKAVSMIAIHAHDIPHIFPPQVLREADAAEACGMAGARTGATCR